MAKKSSNKELNTIYGPEEKKSHMKTWHYIAIAVVLIIIVLAILFSPIGGSALRLPF